MTAEAHPFHLSDGVAVVLVNLGTPDAPEPEAVRRYLGEFLTDRRVVELPSLLWRPILYGFVLRTRPRKSAHAYKQVWTEEGSPLAAIGKRQAAVLGKRMPDIPVGLAMRYGNPGIESVLGRLASEGYMRILVAPDMPPPSTEIRIEIRRNGSAAFEGKTALDRLKRSPKSLVEWLWRDNSFPSGCFLSTGTGIVPADSFTLQPGDEVRITIDPIGTLTNTVA